MTKRQRVETIYALELADRIPLVPSICGSCPESVIADKGFCINEL